MAEKPMVGAWLGDDGESRLIVIVIETTQGTMMVSGHGSLTPKEKQLLLRALDDEQLPLTGKGMTFQIMKPPDKQVTYSPLMQEIKNIVEGADG